MTEEYHCKKRVFVGRPTVSLGIVRGAFPCDKLVAGFIVMRTMMTGFLFGNRDN